MAQWGAMLCYRRKHKAEGGRRSTAARQASVVWLRPPLPSPSALLVTVRLTTTERDDNDLVGGSRGGGGEGVRQPLHQVAVDRPVANDHRHRLPGWQLNN